MSWQRALDVQLEASKYYSSKEGQTFACYFFESLFASHFGDIEMPTKDIFNMSEHLKHTMWSADTIFITSDMMHLIMQAAHDLPDDVTFDEHVLIAPKGFVLFEEALQGEDINGVHITMSAVAWELAPAHVYEGSEEMTQVMNLFFFTDTTDPNDEINERVVASLQRFGRTVPNLALCHYYPAEHGVALPVADRQGTELVVAIIKLFVAMQLIAQQRIGEPIKMRPPRATRRRMERDPDAHPERMITLITLRRKSVKKEHDGEPIEWSRRWVVRGHWRKQWYAKTKRHDWVYIYEHIKGPEDKPLIITERRVFNFRR